MFKYAPGMESGLGAAFNNDAEPGTVQLHSHD